MLELWKLGRSFKMLLFLRHFLSFVRVPLWMFSEMECVCMLSFCFLPIFWGIEFACTLETLTINTVLSSHQWSKVSKFAASRLCLVTEIAYCVHTVLGLRLPGVTVGYCLKFLHFMFSAKPLLGFHSQALTLQGKFEFHKSLKVIRCCLGIQ